MRFFDIEEKQMVIEAANLSTEYVFDHWKEPPTFVIRDVTEGVKEIEEFSLEIITNEEQMVEADELFVAFLAGYKQGMKKIIDDGSGEEDGEWAEGYQERSKFRPLTGEIMIHFIDMKENHHWIQKQNIRFTMSYAMLYICGHSVTQETFEEVFSQFEGDKSAYFKRIEEINKELYGLI